MSEKTEIALESTGGFLWYGPITGDPVTVSHEAGHFFWGNQSVSTEGADGLVVFEGLVKIFKSRRLQACALFLELDLLPQFSYVLFSNYPRVEDY